MSILFQLIVIVLCIVAGLFVLFILGSFFGSAFMLGYVIKKSTEKKSPEFLLKEKTEMQVKVQEMKQRLDAESEAEIHDITNDLDYSYKRWITSILTGYMNNPHGKKVLAFQRRQRGNNIDCRILAQTLNTSYYFEMNPVETIVETNGKKRGSILSSGDIVTVDNRTIGSMLRIGMPEEYTIEFRSGASATIKGSRDNKPFINNIWFERVNHPIPIRRKPHVYRPPYDPYSMVSGYTTLTPEEKEWVIAAAILESLVYSFSFTS